MKAARTIARILKAIFRVEDARDEYEYYDKETNMED